MKYESRNISLKEGKEREEKFERAQREEGMEKEEE